MAAINSAKERRCNHTLDDFDKSGLVIAWLDACRSGQLSTLLNLYEERATLRCDCEGVDLAGRNSLTIYWKSKLQSKAASAFSFDDVIQIGDETQVRCQSCKGKPVRVHFLFSPSGKILKAVVFPHLVAGGQPCDMRSVMKRADRNMIS